MQDGVWNGDWGILRNYTRKRGDLYALPNNPRPLVPGNSSAFMKAPRGVCPVGAPLKTFDITAVAANLVLPKVDGVTITPTGDQVLRAGTPTPELGILPTNVNIATLHAGGPLTGTGTLVYNSRTTPVTGTAQHITVNERGPLHDPTAMMYVLTSDLDIDKQKRPTGKLKAGVPIEPLVLRVNAGDCVEVIVRNVMPEVASDLPNYNMMRLANKRDRARPEGSTYFGVNLIRPSSNAGFHTQLLEYDVTLSDGTNVGVNPDQTVSPSAGQRSRTMVFYAGDLAVDESQRTPGAAQDTAPMIATAIEFGPANILPADRVKQPQKGLFGQLVVQPRGATIHNPATGALITNGKGVAVDVKAPALAEAGIDTVNQLPGTTAENYRDFALVWQKMMNYRYASGNAVQNESEEGPGTPENPPHTILNAANYRAEPTFFRFGIPPLSAAGGAGCAAGAPITAPKPAGAGDVTCFGAVVNAGSLFSNTIVSRACAADPTGPGCDPQTPIFTVKAGDPFRIGLTSPNSSNRAATFQLHGHVWPRDPFVALKRDSNGFPLNANIDNVGSVTIGNNPLQFYVGAQESIIGSAHFVIKPLNGAGGVDRVPGDYLFRDTAAAGMGGGAWGILRVQ